MNEQLLPPDKVQTDAERIRGLARDLGSEKNIDAATGMLVFNTEEDADNFKELANEQGLGVRIVKKAPQETGGMPIFRVTPEEKERAAMAAESSAPE